MGLTPVYSESTEFPVRHDLPAVDSCYAAVESASDVMILVLGMRYGSVDANGRSVTHNEYVQAKAAGIPVLVLVDKQVLDLIPIVERNPEVDLSDKVDDMRVFDFVNGLLAEDRKWVFAYSKLEDVEGIVVDQLAILFGECLHLYKQLGESADASLLALMGPASRRVYLGHSELWEYELFESLLFEYFAASDLKFKELEVKYGYGREVLDIDEDDPDIAAAVLEFRSSSRRVLHLLHNWSVLIGGALNDALGAPGVAGEGSKLVFTARRLADLYGEFLEEYNRIARYERVESLAPLTLAYTNMLSPGLEYMGDTPSLWQERVEMIRDALATGTKSIDLSFTIPAVEGDDFGLELNRLAAAFGV